MDTRRCEEVREVLSAFLDGESGAFPLLEAEIHLASCADCEAFRHSAVELHRRARVVPAAPRPDRTDEIFAHLDAAGAVPTAPGRSRARDVRGLLVFVALIQLAIAVPMLLGRVPELDDHAARHFGAFTLAVGAGFAYVGVATSGGLRNAPARCGARRNAGGDVGCRCGPWNGVRRCRALGARPGDDRSRAGLASRPLEAPTHDRRRLRPRHRGTRRR